MRHLRIVFLFLTVLLIGNLGHSQTLGSLHNFENGTNQLFIDKGESLKNALVAVEEHYNVGILYRSDIIEGIFIDQASTLPLNIEEALSYLLNKTDLQYKSLNPKTYGIYRDVSAIKVPADVLQQSISGTVTAADDGEPLPGVNITIPDSNTGTTTDMDGNYSLTVADSVNVLVFSFIGFQTQQVQINGRTEIDIAMQSQVYEAGEELVVIGYGTQQKGDLTGSVSTVSVDEVRKVPTANVQDALQGQVAGVQITPESGAPGAQADVRIRGVGTLNNASPIYVVDGLILDDISFLNTNDIESIQVLKDASATAIYGVRGANGVIIITTNQGVQGETQLEFSSYAGVQNVQSKIDVTNAREYATLANELAENEGFDPLFDNPNQFGQGTDWQDVVYRPGAIQNYQLRASGGNENLTYSISGNYLNQEGIVRGSDFERLTLRLNNTYNLADNINFGHNVALIYDDRTEAAGGVVGAAYRTDPTIDPFTEDGDFTDASARSSSGNPEASIFYNGRNDNYGYRTVGDAYFTVTFLDNFEFRSSFGLDLERNQFRSFTPEFEVSPTQRNEDSNVNVEAEFLTNWLWENTVTYQEDFGDHGLTVLGGITAQEQQFEDLGGERINVPGSDKNLWYLSAGQEEGQLNFNEAEENSYYSYLARVNYEYKDRYLFTGSYRIDGSSRFTEENRWGYFPSAAIGWVASQESFMENLDEISYLKLRASYGVIGNDKIGSYPTFVTVTRNNSTLAVFGPDQGIYNGATITQIVNRDQIWEETEQLDIGMELNLFDNRLQSEIDYYRRDTNGILVPVPIPFYTGVFNEPVVNAAEVRNDGFDFNISWRESRGDWSYSIGLVASTVNNEVLELGQGNEEILAGGLINEIGATTRTVEGGEIGAFWGYEAIGVFQTEEEIANSPTRGSEEPGDLIYKDQNGDGIINSDDRVEIGSPISDWIYGLNLDFSFRGFDLSMSFDGQAGHDIFNAKRAVRFGVENFETSRLDRWTGPGTSNTEPRVTNAGHNYLPSTHFLEDGDFLRLRNLQVGYTIPVTLANQIGVRNIRLYANATNVFTITDYSGYTPQIGGGNVLATSIDRFGGIYPVSSVYTGGIEISF
jgi:TonB-linked SusC/RagA family outer membrane protein